MIVECYILPSFSTVVAISLDTPVTDQDIATIARDYLVRWEELAPHLGLTVQQEQSIREYEDRHFVNMKIKNVKYFARGRETREMEPPTTSSSQLQKPYPTCS